MTVNSLINFGVPGLSEQRSAPMQPIMGNKFRVSFHSFADMENPYILTQQVRSVQLPRLTFKIKENEFSKPEADDAHWEYSKIVFLDEISGELFKTIMVQAKLQETEGLLFKMDIDILGSGPQRVLRRYTHTGCSLVSIDPFRSLSYSNAEAIEFMVRIRYVQAVALIPIAQAEGFEQL